MNSEHYDLFKIIEKVRKEAGYKTPIPSSLTDNQKVIIENLKPGERKNIDGISYHKSIND